MAKQNTEDFLLEAKNFLETYKKEIGKSVREGKNVVYIDFNELASFSPKLAELLINEPEETFQILEAALEKSDLVENPRARITNLPDSYSEKVRNLRSKHLNKLIQVEGIVRQASEVRPQVVNAKFECPSCGTIMSVLQVESKFREPKRCSCGRRGNFKLIKKDMVDAQRIVVEESPESLIGGEQPRRVNVFLKEDLVEPKMEERTTPGSKVKLLGSLKEIPIASKSGGQLTRSDIAIEANNVTPMEETFEDLEISDEEERQIKELAASPKILERFISSVAPSIYGYHEIKKALILQLFGGIKKIRSDGTKTRGDFHVLLVGDPGVAKSQLLKFIGSTAPKGRYVAGKSASAAGITATVVKDEYLRGWSLEAGAMVLANRGVICIDELDKMGQEDRSSMHEAMEQQCMMPDFKLTLANGTCKKIGDLVDNLIEKNKSKVHQGKDCEILPVKNIKLLSTDFTNHLPLQAERVSRHIAPKEFIKIELTNGNSIKVTPEHPCWIVQNGKIKTLPAEKLTSKNYFPVPSKINIIPSPYKKENDYLCKILGYHLSDGCYELKRGKKNGIQFWNNNKQLIKDYLNSIKNYFNLNPIIVKRKNQFAVRVISKKVVQQIKKLGPCLLEKGHLKKIPEKIMNLPNENVRYLLRTLFDGDGTITYQKRNGCRTTLVSQNKEMLEQVSDLLLRFEIQSSIFKDKNVWRLDISGQANLSRFLINISFLSQHKKQKLKTYCEKTKTYRTIKDIIPNCTEKINKIFKTLKISQKKAIGHSIDLHVEKQRKFLQKLVLIAEKHAILKNKNKILKEIQEIKKLAFGYARWIKIKNVERIKNENIKWVYDVTIEPFHTFISNRMILHNTVTISKANIQATLKAETSVLAAANPKFGRFDPYQTVASQINIPPTLINRFDVIFVLKDMPDKDKDEAIASHVLSEHTRQDKKSPLSRDLFRKYVAYSKQKISPSLTEEAIKEIKKFYVDLRNMPSTSDEPTRPLPISARQLEALVRLSEASAKVRLSKKVEKKDALVAIDLMKYYLMQVGYDYETKTFDIDRIASGVSTSQRGKIMTVKETLSSLQSKLGKLIPVEELKKTLQGKIPELEIDDALQKLKMSGDIFNPRKGYIQMM